MSRPPAPMRPNPPIPQVIALGGGGFSTDPADVALERYVLAQARSEAPAVCFLATASGDAEAYVARFHQAFAGLPCRRSQLGLFGRAPDVRRELLRQDVVFVGGGNTRSMLAVWREWGLPELLRQAWSEGIVLAGVSAGAICWFEAGITDSSADRLDVVRGLGLLPGTCCPHYDAEPERRPALHRLLAEGAVPPALALDDGVAAHFVGGELQRVVSSRAGAGAWRVERGPDGAVVERPLAAERL